MNSRSRIQLYSTMPVKLVSLVSKRQTGVTEEEVWRFKWLLQSVMENVFRIPYIKQEIDADEGGTVEVTFNDFIVLCGISWLKLFRNSG